MSISAFLANEVEKNRQAREMEHDIQQTAIERDLNIQRMKRAQRCDTCELIEAVETLVDVVARLEKKVDELEVLNDINFSILEKTPETRMTIWYLECEKRNALNEENNNE